MSEPTPFESYLEEKRIDAVRFREVASQEWERMQAHFSSLGKASFDSRKKFLINNLRLQYPLSAED